MNNGNNQNWIQRNFLLVMLILGIVYIGFAGMAFAAYRLAGEVKTELETFNALYHADIEPVQVNQEKLDILLDTAIELEAIEERALNYLGLFEAIGFAFAAIGGLFAFIGVVAGFRYDDAMKQMDKALQRMNEIDDQFQSRRRALHESGLAQSLMALAERQYRARDIEGALKTYERAVELDENNPVVYYYIGYLQTHKNMLNQARDTLLKALKLEPLPQIQAALGYAYRRIGDEAENRKNYARRDEYYALANKHLSEALESSPRLVDVDGESWYGSLAGLHKRLGNLGDDETPEEERAHLEQARYYYGEAAKVTPLSSYPQFNIAMITMRLEESVDAAHGGFVITKKLIENELQADHDNYWYWANLLLTRIALQDFKDIEDTVDTLNQLIPLAARDVKPRIVNDILEIRSFLKDTTVLQRIDQLIEQLNTAS